jgi:tetratricopeptide (TPR) repeat protein
MRWPGADSLALAMAIAAVVVIAWPRRAGHCERPPSPPARAALPAARSGPSPADRPIVVGNVPQEPPGFQSRAGLLAQLDRASGQVSVIHAVTGMPGVGTTQLAAAYARARLAAGWRLVAWVDAADRGVLLAGLARVAEALGLADDPGGGAGQAVRHWLEADGRRCLVVFDNAADPGGIRPFLPAGGSARVLITSNQRPAAGLGAGVGVGVFCPDEALAFLAGRTGLADAEGAGALARELGYHPLALAVAASAVAAQRLAYATYLSRLRAVPAYAHVARKERPSFPCGAARAILLSLDTVRTGDRAGVCSGIMELAAVLSAAGVRRGLLRDAGRAGVLATGLHRTEVSAGLVNRALAALAERSLVSFSLDGETVTVHGLVTRVVQDGMVRWNRSGTVCRDAAAVLDKRARALVTSTDRLAVRDIAVQVTALQETMTGAGCGTDDEMARMMLRLRSWALYYLTVLGDSAEQAIVTGRPVTADLELTLGADHPDTLAAWSNLALACQDAGRPGEAVPLHERALAGRERVLGAGHPDTLASRSNLALACQDAGRAAEAVPLFEQVLAGREWVLGADHPDTLAARGNLAVAYQEVGRGAEAIPLFEQALRDRERMLGADHPDTLAARSNLALARQDAGRAAEAVPLFEQVLAGRERVLGADHPRTLASRHNLAIAYQKEGRSGEAIALFEQTLAAHARSLGPGHPRTLASRASLASAYRDAGL